MKRLYVVDANDVLFQHIQSGLQPYVADVQPARYGVRDQLEGYDPAYDRYITVDDFQHIGVLYVGGVTDIDECERQHRASLHQNVIVPMTLSELVMDGGGDFICFSSDQVFSGQQASHLYTHATSDDPLDRKMRTTHRYGQQKARAEAHIRLVGGTTIRTSWVYGPGRPSYVGAVLSRVAKKEPLVAASDYVSVPTNVTDLIAAVGQILTSESRDQVYHLVGSGKPVNRYEFTKAILEDAGLDAYVEPVTCKEMVARGHWRVPRGPNCTLRPSHRPELPDWRASLTSYIASLQVPSS